MSSICGQLHPENPSCAAVAVSCVEACAPPCSASYSQRLEDLASRDIFFCSPTRAKDSGVHPFLYSVSLPRGASSSSALSSRSRRGREQAVEQAGPRVQETCHYSCSQRWRMLTSMPMNGMPKGWQHDTVNNIPHEGSDSASALAKSLHP